MSDESFFHHLSLIIHHSAFILRLGGGASVPGSRRGKRKTQNLKYEIVKSEMLAPIAHFSFLLFAFYILF